MVGCGGSPSSFEFTLVGGTWSFDGDDRADARQWCAAGSPFWRFLLGQRILPSHDEGFVWSSDVDGGFRFPWQKRRFRDWAAGGHALAWYLEDVTPSRRLVIAHSHGGAVAVFAASFGCRIERLVTIGTPVRRDREVRAVIERARPNIGRWLHVAVSGDKMQWLGQLFDGAVSLGRDYLYADRRDRVRDKRVGHSGLVNNPEHFPLWVERGWLAYLTEPLASESKVAA